jgi:hypothetical protein
MGGVMIIEEAMLFFRVKFHDNEQTEEIIRGIEEAIPETDRFSSEDKHEWHIHNRYRRRFEELITSYVQQTQMTLF